MVVGLDSFILRATDASCAYIPQPTKQAKYTGVAAEYVYGSLLKFVVRVRRKWWWWVHLVSIAPQHHHNASTLPPHQKEGQKQRPLHDFQNR
jgi:hypothetical protein